MEKTVNKPAQAKPPEENEKPLSDRFMWKAGDVVVLKPAKELPTK